MAPASQRRAPHQLEHAPKHSRRSRREFIRTPPGVGTTVLLSRKTRTANRKHKVQQADIPPTAFQQLAQFGYVRRATLPASSITSSVRIFGALELVAATTEQYRIGVIFWPEETNSQFELMPFDIRLPNGNDVAEGVKEEGAVTIDAPACFTHYEWPHDSTEHRHASH